MWWPYGADVSYHLHLLRYYHRELGGILQPIFVSPWVPDEKATAQTIKAMTTVSNLAFIQQRTPDEVSESILYQSWWQIPSVMVNLVTIEPAPNPNSSWRNKVTDLAARVRGGSRRVAADSAQTEWNKEIAVVGSCHSFWDQLIMVEHDKLYRSRGTSRNSPRSVLSLVSPLDWCLRNYSLPGTCSWMVQRDFPSFVDDLQAKRMQSDARHSIRSRWFSGFKENTSQVSTYLKMDRDADN